MALVGDAISKAKALIPCQKVAEVDVLISEKVKIDFVDKQLISLKVSFLLFKGSVNVQN